MAFSDYSFVGGSSTLPSLTTANVLASTGALSSFDGVGDTRRHRPDKPLIVKCTFDRSMRRITFASAQNCSFDLLRTRVEQCFSLYASSFIVTYKDDDGEITDITCDDDLTEAIQYFHLGDDTTSSYGPPISSGSSSYSGYSNRSNSSGSSRKITLRVDVQVDYDGPSLSDTASLSSLEEYKDKNKGSDDGSLGSYVNVNNEGGSLRSFGREIGDIDEDAVTVSSRPTIAVHSTGNSGAGNAVKPITSASSVASTESFSLLRNRAEAAQPLRLPTNGSSTTLLADPTKTPKDQKLEMSPSQGKDVFEWLKASETTKSPTLSPAKAASGGSMTPGGGGTAQWLKEQSVQMIQSVLGGLHTAPSTKASSISDLDSNPPHNRLSLSSDFATEEDEGGILQPADRELEEEDEIPGGLELELGRNGRGGFFYTYTGSVMSHSGDDHEDQGKKDKQPIASTSAVTPSLDTHQEEEYFPAQERQDDLKYMQYLPPSHSSDTLVAPDPAELTECSSCGIILDTFRYVCASCGPRPPRLALIADAEEIDGDPTGKGKGKVVPPVSPQSSASSIPASNTIEAQHSPNSSQQSLSTGSSSYSPQRPLHDYMQHSHGHYPGHRHSHSHGSPFQPPLHPPFGHHVGLNMNMGHLHPHMIPHMIPHHRPPHMYPPPPPQLNFIPPSSSFPPPFTMQYPPQPHPPMQLPPSPGGSTIWTQSEGNVPLSNLGPSSAPNGLTLPPGTPNSTTGLLHNKPLPRLPHLNTYPPAYGAPNHSPSSSISSTHQPYQPPSSQPPGSSPQPTPTLQSPHGSQRSESIIEGFELCTDCMETAGIEHASESVATNPEPSQGPGSAGNSPYVERSPYHVPGSYGSSSGYSQPNQYSQHSPGGLFAGPSSSGSGASTHSAGSGSWKRGVPKKKGQLRHAFKEKVWTPNGWTDVEHGNISKCTTCGSELTTERYKCATCLDMVVCRGCYSQIHEIHPIHAFLTVPEKRPQEPASEPGDDGSGERSLSHDGLKCSHCLMEIVGARFHCAICPSVDICSNCESAGLPGNLTSPDGGHDSSHIMIKVPFPLSNTEVDAASRRALSLWTGRDAPNLQANSTSATDGSHRVNSGATGGSNYADTVIGSGSDASRNGTHRMDHGMNCNGCGKGIIGVRYQCAGCPSPDGQGYSLCADCEARSYQLHDSMHCFFKIPRPVDRKIQEEDSLLPPLYILAAGESLEEMPPNSQNDPRAYLQTIVHRVALCDRCIHRIVGEWFHCAYCAKDLCDACEAMDSHDASHLFVVFKSVVDMSILRTLTDVENPQDSRPLISYPVYTRPL